LIKRGVSLGKIGFGGEEVVLQRTHVAKVHHSSVWQKVRYS